MLLKVKISSMIEISNPPYSLINFCEKHLSRYNPAYIKRKQRRQPTYNLERIIYSFIYDRQNELLLIPKALLYKIEEYCVYNNCELEKDIIKQYENTLQGPEWGDNGSLRSYQEEAMLAAHNTSGVLVAPAGSGKTVMGLYYISMQQLPAIWLVHTNDLLYQAKSRAEAFLAHTGEIGVIGDGNLSYGDKKLIIATFQTLNASPDIIDNINKLCQVAIVDEAHHVPSNMFLDVVARLNMEFILGLTATPERKDGLEFLMFDAIGPLLHQVKREQLYTDNQLIKPEVRFIYTNFNDNQSSDFNTELNSVNAGGENFDYTTLMYDLHNNKERMQLIVDNIINNVAAENYQIVLSESIDYCYKLRNLVLAKLDEKTLKGVVVEVLHGTIPKHSWHVVSSKREALQMIDDDHAVDYKYDTKANRYKVKLENYSKEELDRMQISRSKRKLIMKMLQTKQIHILFATHIAREGLDIPHLNIGHSVSPKQGDMDKKKNGVSVEQEIGRIMRPDPDNIDKKAIWFDYVDDKCQMFKIQYYNRRKVYKRLGIPLPRKNKTRMQSVEEFLNNSELYN